MSASLWNRFLRPKSRPTSRGRRARPGVEALDGRLLLTVFTNFVNGQLQVTDNSFSDLVTLDHSGSNTFVNGSAFPDSQITNGILIQVGSGVGIEDKVNILATIKPVTVDGQFDVDEVDMGKNGSMQSIQAPVTLIDIGTGSFTTSNSSYDLTLDDSADMVARNVTLSTANGLRTVTNLAPTTISFDDIGLLTLTINGGSGGNTFNVLHTPFDGTSGSTKLNTGTGNDTVNVLGIDGDPNGGVFTFGGDLSIQGQGGVDTVHVGNAGSVQGIQGLVNISNHGGFTALFLDDSADAVARSITMDFIDRSGIHTGRIRGLAPEEIQFEQSAVHFVQVDAGSGGNTFTIEDTFKNGTTSNTTRIDTGIGSDQVFVHRTTGRLELNGQSGLDGINISSAFFPGGSLQGIQGDITITNQFSRSRLTVNGAADAFDRTVTLAAGVTLGEIRGLAPGVIFYTPNDVSTITLNGGSGRDTFFVTSTGSPAPMQINGLGGNDTFIVGNRNTLDDIRTPLTLNGNAGSDTLIVNDQASPIGHIYGVTATTVTRQVGTSVTINYGAMEFLQLNKSPVPIVFGTDPFFPPQAKNLALPNSIRVGRAAKLTGRLVDGNKGDKLSLTVDWGDGSAPQVSRPDRKSFSLKHKYQEAGTDTVRAIWTDSQGESNFRDLSLTVTPVRSGATLHGHAAGHRAAAPRR
jgi:hypothetical protein